MTRESRLWLAAAAAVAVVVVAVVLVFGYTRPPAFASLYSDGGPAIAGTVAWVEDGRQGCVQVLDVASGDSHEVYCDDWLWLESWDEDGNLRVHTGNGVEEILVLDPQTGDVLATGRFEDGPPPGDEGGPPPEESSPLRSRSNEGRVILTHGTGAAAVDLIDIEAPRNYRFFSYGMTPDGDYVWAYDSEDRLLVVAVDGGSEPWLIAEGIQEPLWR